MADDMKVTLKRMQVLRDNLLLEGKISDQNLDLYGFLSSSLARDMKEVPALANILTQVNRRMDDALMFYDPRQSGYWEGRSPEVIKLLDNALFRIKRHEFDSIEDRHHILQAVKYSGITDLKSTYRDDPELLESIKPAHGAVPDNAKQRWWERATGLLFGATYTTEQHDLQTWRVRGSPQYARDVMAEAKARGYSTVLFDVKERDISTLRERLSDAGYESTFTKPPEPKEGSVFMNPNSTVEARIEHTPLVRIPSPMGTFEKILGIVPSTEAENSLELAPGNYHTYGRAFIDCVMGQLPSDAIIVQPQVDKENSLVIFDQTVDIGPYTRSSKLYCSAGVRKIIIAVTDEPQHERMLKFALSERVPVSLHMPGKHYVWYGAVANGTLTPKEEF